jgi:hypothetical protein
MILRPYLVYSDRNTSILIFFIAISTFCTPFQGIGVRSLRSACHQSFSCSVVSVRLRSPALLSARLLRGVHPCTLCRATLHRILDLPHSLLPFVNFHIRIYLAFFGPFSVHNYRLRYLVSISVHLYLNALMSRLLYTVLSFAKAPGTTSIQSKAPSMDLVLSSHLGICS